MRITSVSGTGPGKPRVSLLQIGSASYKPGDRLTGRVRGIDIKSHFARIEVDPVNDSMIITIQFPKTLTLGVGDEVTLIIDLYRDRPGRSIILQAHFAKDVAPIKHAPIPPAASSPPPIIRRAVELEEEPASGTQPGHRSKYAISFLSTASDEDITALGIQILQIMRKVSIIVSLYGENHFFLDRPLTIRHEDWAGIAKICPTDYALFDRVTGSYHFFAIVAQAVWGNSSSVDLACKLAMEGIGPDSTPQDLIAAIREGKVFDIVLANG